MLSLPHLIRNSLCDFLTIWFICIFFKHTSQFFFCNCIQSLCCTDSCFLIQAQIQRTICFKRKTSFRIIDLHGRHSQVCQNKIKTACFLCNLINRTEILQTYRKKIFSKSLLFQSLFCLCSLFMIYICSINMALSLQALKHSLGMTSISQSCIKTNLPRLDL